MRRQRLVAAVAGCLLATGLVLVLVPGSALAVPAQPPGAAAVRAPADPHQIRVSWKPVSGADHYVVELFDGVSDTFSTVGAEVNAVTLDASDPCAKYMVRVGARDSADQGNTTKWMNVRSLAPGGVGGLSVARNADRTGATATWRSPLWAGFRALSGYRTQLVRQPDNKVVTDRVGADPTVMLTGMDRATKYTLLVTSQNEFGSCLTAKATIGSDRPGIPLGLTANRDPKSPGTVMANWEPPADLAAPPAYYLVNYSSPGKLTKAVRVNAPTTTARVDLDPARAWTLRVQSFNDIGGSPTLSNTVALPAGTPAPSNSPDKIAPTITASATPAPNARGWSRGPVTVTFTCADGQSGVAACTTPITVSDEGAALAVTGTAIDKAGNTTKRTATVNIDRTPPAITASATPAPNARGWSRGPVTVTFTCSDSLSDVAVCPSPVRVLGDIATRSVVTGTASDTAGNTATAGVTVTIDRTTPTIVAATPAANADGWHNAPVTVTFGCADALSGIDACTLPVTVAGDGAAQNATGTATDRAGNTAATTATVNIDQTDPTVTAVATPAANANGWHNAPVTVAFGCADALSGVETCSRPVPLDGEGAAQAVTGSATDRAGNTAAATATVNIDQTVPTVTATLVDATTAAGWSNTDQTIHYTCADALSGVEVCPADVTVDTDGADQTITRAAVDRAGNTTAVVITVSVDRTKPVITTVRAAANAAGWTNQDVTVAYTCTAPVSGVATCSPPATVTDEGGDQTVTGIVTNNAGTSTSVTTTVSIDKTPPTIAATVDGTKNAAGWYTGPVTVHYTCADALSGIGVCPADVAIGGDGADQAVTATAVDTAGNATNTTVTVSIDKARPTIAATVDGTKNAAGWYTGPVTVHYTCTDALSGIGVCPADVAIGGDGADQTVTATAVDAAGNTAVAAVTGINVDRTPPVVQLRNAVKGATYSLDNTPTVTCLATDTLSGVAVQATAKNTRDTRGGYTAACSSATDTAGNTARPLTVTYTVKPTGTALTTLTNLYISVNVAPNARGFTTAVGDLLATGRYCDYITKVTREAGAKTPNVSPAQAAELTYWALILNGKRC